MGISKDILPFPLSFCPTAAEISFSLEAGRAQLGQAEGAEVALDEYIQEAGLEAWTFLVTWALNFDTSTCTAEEDTFGDFCRAPRCLNWIGQASWRPRGSITTERRLKRPNWLRGGNWSQRCRRLGKQGV